MSRWPETEALIKAEYDMAEQQLIGMKGPCTECKGTGVSLWEGDNMGICRKCHGFIICTRPEFNAASAALARAQVAYMERTAIMQRTSGTK